MNGTSEAKDIRAMRRALRLLEGGSAKLSHAAAEDQVLLDAGERGVLGMSVAVFEALKKDGVISLEREIVRLSGADAQTAGRKRDRPADPLQPLFSQRVLTTVPGEGSVEPVTINLAESPLGLLWQRRNRKGESFLTTDEFHAGERLRADYTRGQIMPRLGVNWSAAGAAGRRSGDTNGFAEMTDAALAARHRVERAIDAVGPELSGVLIDICCFLKGVELVEAERGWPARSAKVMLKSALAALARHYEPPRAASRKTPLHWGADGYRPDIG